MPKPVHSSIRKDAEIRVRVPYIFLDQAKALVKRKKMNLSEFVRSLIEQELSNTK